ncbi:MAG: sigma 54-interacting transcriptional regulator, partial [Spirochaetales bacterium]
DDALFSDTLFGHVPGSYTGAISGRHGLVRRAENGTLFLDEIGDLSPASQTKLLRLLENREFYPIGSDRSVKTNARFVVATHRDLAARVREGSFRRDLYYRLRVQELDLPPLYQRECDLEPLARLFAERAAKDSGRPAPRLGPEFTRLLHTYSFPGNVRELLAMMHRAVALCPRDVLAHADFSPALEPIRAIRLRSAQDEAATEQPDAQAIRFMTEELPTLNRVVGLLVREALDRSGGNQSGAARLLGITPSAVNKRLRNAATEES